jgi:hypothetical protein
MKPTQLRVVREAASKGTEICDHVRDISADDEVAQGGAGCGLHLVASPDGKGESMAA